VVVGCGQGGESREPPVTRDGDGLNPPQSAVGQSQAQKLLNRGDIQLWEGRRLVIQLKAKLVA
jgi:hypothetical protein